MDNISFLTPAFTSENDKITSLEQLKQEVESKFGSLNFTAYKLVPLTADDNLKEISNFVISSGQSPSVKDVSNTAHKVEQLEATLARAKSALKTTMLELTKAKTQAKMSRNKRVKKLEDENKKLRSAFATQLMEGQSYRQSSQSRMALLESEISELKQQLSSPRDVPINVPVINPREPKENQPETKPAVPKMMIPNINMNKL